MRAGLPRTALCLLLATLLVAIQQLGFAHALTHIANPVTKSGSRNDAPLSADKVCIECLAFAQLGGGLTTHAPPVLEPAATPPFAARSPVSWQATFTPHFHSRAPPRPA
jgi:hypothetical protein